MKQFLQTSTRLEQLAFIRDVMYRYVVHQNEEALLFELVVEQLKKLDLEAEVQRMLTRT